MSSGVPSDPRAERHTDFFDGATVPTPPIPDDDGSPSTALMEALERMGGRRSGASEVLQALSSARLFVPVLAILDDAVTGADGIRREKSSSMAAVLVESEQHGRAQLAFSSIESLSAWNRRARPVPVMAPVAARAAVAGSADALLVDIGGPVPFALVGTELLLMASLASPSSSPSPGEHDPVLHRALGEVVHRMAPGARARLESPAGGPARLLVAGVTEGGVRAEIVRQLSEDPVVRRLLPDGMRVVFGDTP